MVKLSATIACIVLASCANCAFMVCHGDDERPLKIYAAKRFRLGISWDEYETRGLSPAGSTRSRNVSRRMLCCWNPRRAVFALSASPPCAERSRRSSHVDQRGTTESATVDVTL